MKTAVKPMPGSVIRIGQPPQGPPVKRVRAPRAPHWIDLAPKAVALVVIWAFAIGRIAGWWG